MIAIILFILYASLFSFVIYKHKFFHDRHIKPLVFPTLFLIKLGFGLLFLAVYTYYYKVRADADMYKYFDDSAVLFDCLIHGPRTFYDIVFRHDSTSSAALIYLNKMNHWQLGYHRQFENNHHLIILFNVVCRFFSFGYILPHIIFINFLSFVGMVAVWKSFRLFFEDRKLWFLIPVFLIPSTLFWCSGLLKESLILFAMGAFLYPFLRFILSKENRFGHLFISILFFSLLFMIKSYMAIAILPMLLIGLLMRYTKFKYIGLSFIATIMFFAILAFCIQYIIPSIDPMQALNNKLDGFREVMSAATPGSAYDINVSIVKPTDFIRLVPITLFLCLLRPFFWEANSPFMLLGSFENLVFWVLFSTSMIQFMRQRQYKKFTAQQFYLLLSLLSILFILFIIIGISSFNFGTLFRYKAPVLIFLFALPFMCISDQFVEKVNISVKFPLFFKK